MGIKKCEELHRYYLSERTVAHWLARNSVAGSIPSQGTCFYLSLFHPLFEINTLKKKSEPIKNKKPIKALLNPS